MISAAYLPDPPVRKSIRRLRWFVSSFEAQMQSMSEQTGVDFALRDDRLTAAFLDWIDVFEKQKPDVSGERIPYINFAAGLMLRTLISHDPIYVAALPTNATDTRPAYFWPEGHLYTAYCLNIRDCVLRESLYAVQDRPMELDDIRTWWSFRENVREDPSLAIAFLDLFSGQEPDWSTPSLFRSDRYVSIIQQDFDRLSL